MAHLGSPRTLEQSRPAQFGLQESIGKGGLRTSLGSLLLPFRRIAIAREDDVLVLLEVLSLRMATKDLA